MAHVYVEKTYGLFPRKEKIALMLPPSRKHISFKTWAMTAWLFRRGKTNLVLSHWDMSSLYTFWPDLTSTTEYTSLQPCAIQRHILQQHEITWHASLCTGGRYKKVVLTQDYSLRIAVSGLQSQDSSLRITVFSLTPVPSFPWGYLTTFMHSRGILGTWLLWHPPLFTFYPFRQTPKTTWSQKRISFRDPINHMLKRDLLYQRLILTKVLEKSASPPV